MNLVVVSHKECWVAPENGQSESDWRTDGGFPTQMRAVSELFENATFLVPRIPAPISTNGAALPPEATVVALTPPSGRGLTRKLLLPFWFLRNIPTLWKGIRAADCVHAPIPGDVGTVGLFLAVLLRKRLLVRHCGHWDRPRTIAEHFWRKAMVHLANDRRIMFATGVQKENPPPDEAEIHWIFATSLSEADLQSLASPRKLPETDQVLRLVIACRQEEPKGTDRVLRALALLQEDFPEVRLDVVGGGGHLAASKVLCQSLGLIQSVTFHGAVPREEVLEIFQKSTLFCYPSRASEGFPKVVIEALATGLPFVGSDLGVLEYLALRGGGLTTSSLQPEELAETVAHCLSDPERYAAMSNSALETARCYSLEQWQSTIHNALKPWGPLRSDGAHN